MNLQEFISQKPEFAEKAKRVTSKEDFVSLAEREKIKFGAGCLDKAYEFLCNGGNESGKISDDALESVAGGVSNLGVTAIDLGDGVNYLVN